MKILFTTKEACELLNVPLGASREEIEEAFRRGAEKAKHSFTISSGKTKEQWGRKLEEISEARNFLLQIKTFTEESPVSITTPVEIEPGKEPKKGSVAVTPPPPGRGNIAGKYVLIFIAGLVFLGASWFLFFRNYAPASKDRQSSSAHTGKLLSRKPIGRERVIIVNDRDGSRLVEVPAGKFIMGSPPGIGESREKPGHEVTLDAYLISVFEVSNGQFERFESESGYKAEGDWRQYCTPETIKYPVVNVTWNDANTYCRWAGLRLPTEAEWEKAARGDNGKMYPWGDKWNPAACNWYGFSGTPGESLPSGGHKGTRPVDSFFSGISFYGCMNMSGNAYEWCADWYNETYYAGSPETNPRGPLKGTYRVLRGGSWLNLLPGNLRCAARNYELPKTAKNDIGFRCARNVR
ncbi:MAG: formylglycine-generating enzyme family protein [bacterium]